MATVLYEPAKAGCMRLLAVDKSPCSSRFAHKVFFLHVKSTVASGQKREGALAHLSMTESGDLTGGLPSTSVTVYTKHVHVMLNQQTVSSLQTLGV